LVTLTVAVKPPGHSAGTAYVTRHPAAAWALTAAISQATSIATTAAATMPIRTCSLMGTPSPRRHATDERKFLAETVRLS
jgi:hypothetical protein